MHCLVQFTTQYAPMRSSSGSLLSRRNHLKGLGCWTDGCWCRAADDRWTGIRFSIRFARSSREAGHPAEQDTKTLTRRRMIVHG